jgi:myo-inositol-1(or 4)-monophosphatase
MHELPNLMADLSTLCKDVGEFQRRSFRQKNLEIATKSNEADLVTSVDLASDALLKKGLANLLPEAAILSEETGMSSTNSDYCWIIDPLDGTNNFAHGLPVFTISVGLHYKQQAFAGVVYNPILDELYSARRGKGAFCNGEKIQVSNKDRLGICMLATGFPYNKDAFGQKNLIYLSKMIQQSRGIRRLGSAAYDLCLVARGVLDGYWEFNLNLWDIAAGVLLVQEAGGEVITNKQGNAYSVMAASKHVLRIMQEEWEAVEMSVSSGNTGTAQQS